MSTITSEHTEHVSVTLATVISHTFQHYESFAKRNQTSFASNQQNNEGKSSTLPTSSIILIVVVGWVVLVGVIWCACKKWCFKSSSRRANNSIEVRSAIYYPTVSAFHRYKTFCCSLRVPLSFTRYRNIDSQFPMCFL